MSKEYVLPKNWYVKITDENREIINKWKMSIAPNSIDLFSDNKINVVYENGMAKGGRRPICGEHLSYLLIIFVNMY